MRKKYFFFDIDGTLTDRSTGRIVSSAAEAVRKLKAAGHFVSIATGRARYKAERFRQENGFDHMVCNGGHGIWGTVYMWRWMILTKSMPTVSGWTTIMTWSCSIRVFSAWQWETAVMS